ncbi:50S ribosomal protein L11 methyltransferase [Companilactobacillus metriopterae]|uniref:50S ribosomal protein L11 methyltransferase n=1 Tax=Companilactobacillus metriopterae TaxID=1909267 RepID=UPI00100B827C|nr:50S ribosomal protein L11 methyltransferase [Companilactobacillus metriopterae]
MIWKKISVHIPKEFNYEIITNIFEECGANGTEFVDSNSDFNEVNTYFEEQNFDNNFVDNLKGKIQDLKKYQFSVDDIKIVVSDMDDAEWKDSWKEYYHPVQVSRFLTIVPSWIDYQPFDEKESTILIDPGESFGAGTHPTTFTSLQALETILGNSKSLFDVGTGTGILAIYAKMLGVNDITALDIEDNAIVMTKKNISLNPDCNDIKVLKNSLLDGIDETADVIVANILYNILEIFIPDIDSHLNENGYVILSGIIIEKEQWITDLMSEQGFVVLESLHLNGWTTLICRRKIEIEAEDGAILR